MRAPGLETVLLVVPPPLDLLYCGEKWGHKPTLEIWKCSKTKGKPQMPKLKWGRARRGAAARRPARRAGGSGGVCGVLACENIWRRAFFNNSHPLVLQPEITQGTHTGNDLGAHSSFGKARRWTNIHDPRRGSAHRIRPPLPS